eukprot:2519455-Prymnesium_polylepis.1
MRATPDTWSVRQPIWVPVTRAALRTCFPALFLSAPCGDRVVYQSLLLRGAAEAHALVSRIARNSARGTRDGVRIHPHAP